MPYESLNHYSKGAVVSFLHRYVAGLTPIEPGYRTFAVRPQPGGGLTQVALGLATRHGRIEIDWAVEDEMFRLDVVVPDGTTAEITMPGGGTVLVEPGKHEWAGRLDLPA